MPCCFSDHKSCKKEIKTLKYFTHPIPGHALKENTEYLHQQYLNFYFHLTLKCLLFNINHLLQASVASCNLSFNKSVFFIMMKDFVSKSDSKCGW